MLTACYYDGIHYRQELVKCGKPACRSCKSGPSHGPYWYAYARTSAFLKKSYVGKLLPELVEREAVAVSWRNSLFGRQRGMARNRGLKIPRAVD